MTSDRFPPHKHYPEPEIIPPGSPGGKDMDGRLWPREYTHEHRTHRIYVRRIGPLSLLPLALLSALISAAVLLFLLGLLIILLPLAGVILSVAIIANLLRGPSRWPR